MDFLSWPTILTIRFHTKHFPRRQTHPNRLAAVARLFGMEAAPVANCRVLELGCGAGGNLIPLAYYLPREPFHRHRPGGTAD